MWINTSNQQIFRFHSDIRRAFNYVSFPQNITDEALASFGVLPVRIIQPPTVDHTKNVTEGTPALQDGTWVQVWNVTDASAEEITERTEGQAEGIRAERNAKLSSTDWTQGKDIADSLSTPWATYRQALRDVPEQAGFPWTITWPEQP